MPTARPMPQEAEGEATVMEVVCAVLCNDAGEVLICQRPEGKMLAGKWEFPGGKVEPGESFEAALHREMMEELDCTVSVTRVLEPVLHDYGTFVIRLRPFLCGLKHGHPKALEHMAIRWLSVQELEEADLADADKEIVKGMA